MRDLLKFLLLPPMVIYIGLLAGAVLAWRKNRAGLPLLAGSFGLLFLLSLPVVSGGLMGLAERGVVPYGPGQSENKAEAIVVLSAGINNVAPEFGGGPSVDTLTLERLRYGARLHKMTGLPVLVTGGPLGRQGIIVADLMDESLKTDFDTEARWVERAAKTTAGNALGSAALLQPQEQDGVTRILLVTHAWHMNRARAAFERAGFEVTEAPTWFEGMGWFTPGGFVPSAKAFHESYYAVHELVGRLWYWIAG
jgi:uncharacterized SAM-binding protein YcdF (DUF218 family)